MTATSTERGARLRGLYAITPEVSDLPRLSALVLAALDGGARLVQYRAKGLLPDERAAQARALLALCRARAVPFLVNDDLELAMAIGADGVHLGREDGDAGAARSRWPAGLLGVSCYDDPRLAVAAAAQGADYVGIGSVFPSSTKPAAVRARLDCLARARGLSGLPVAAIGGITPANAREACAAGADMIAVISSLFDAPDVRAAARALSQPFQTDVTHV